ncbi:MAG: AbrB/MazE/SpoVT family DNA-binding domain-containing protein [Candidatus Omnitrophica bacterium]|nr:AbrB/MazE/SpoVT family DNA-binding domain-containing protein [Candidatus Omnitrophota bacterium]
MIAQIRQNYQITLPAEIRRRFGLKIGDLVEVAIKGYKLILTPKRAIDLDQAWFWTKEWQEDERRVDLDVKAGRVKKARSAEELLRTLKK